MKRWGVITTVIGLSLICNFYVLDGGGRRIGLSLLAIGVCLIFADFLVGKPENSD